MALGCPPVRVSLFCVRDTIRADELAASWPTKKPPTDDDCKWKRLSKRRSRGQRVKTMASRRLLVRVPRSKSGQLVSCQNLGGMPCGARNLVGHICVKL